MAASPRVSPMKFLSVLFLSSVLGCCGAIASAAPLRAGAFAEDITPTKFPAPINGNLKGAFASDVIDPMHARALALHDGQTELILCVVDSCMIPREICEAAKALAAKTTGVAASH